MNNCTLKDLKSYKPGDNDLGYMFYPRQTPESPGHPRLDIVLRPTPTMQHYDPETLILNLVTSEGKIEKSIIHHPWRPQIYKFQAIAGRIIWQDRVHKVQEAFTFGADLMINSCDDGTACILTSQAPIIPLSNDLAYPTLFVLEVETLMAARRASWLHNTGGYIQRLIKVHPQDLYCSCLKSVHDKIGLFHPDETTEPISRLHTFLNHELNGDLCKQIPLLPELL